MCLDVRVREGEVIVWNAREKRGERREEGRRRYIIQIADPLHSEH